MNLKTFKEHRRLYYDSGKRTWTKHESTSAGPSVSASLLEELELVDMGMDIVSDEEGAPNDWTDDDLYENERPPVSAAQPQVFRMNSPDIGTLDMDDSKLH